MSYCPRNNQKNQFIFAWIKWDNPIIQVSKMFHRFMYTLTVTTWEVPHLWWGWAPRDVPNHPTPARTTRTGKAPRIVTPVQAPPLKTPSTTVTGRIPVPFWVNCLTWCFRFDLGNLNCVEETHKYAQDYHSRSVAEKSGIVTSSPSFERNSSPNYAQRNDRDSPDFISSKRWLFWSVKFCGW